MKKVRGVPILGAAFLVFLMFLPVLIHKSMGPEWLLMKTLGLLEKVGIGGGMISTPYDDGKNSSTKAQMQNLKTALICYHCDLGRVPFTGTVMSSDSLYLANMECFGDSPYKNVLMSPTVIAPFENVGIPSGTYAKRWKGPYLDGKPQEFMKDAWESRILYLYWDSQLWLHSAGADGIRDSIDQVTSRSYSGDDITTSVMKFRKPFPGL